MIYPRLLTGGVCHPGLLHKLKSYGISGQIFGLISSFLSNRWLQVVVDGKSSQEYPVNARVPQGPILSPKLFLLYINDLPYNVICHIAIYADDTTLYSKCDQTSDVKISCKNVNQQVKIFNKTIINMFSNFVPNKLVTFNDKDLSWMIERLKEKIK